MRISFNPNVSRNYAKNLNFGAIGPGIVSKIQDATVTLSKEEDPESVTSYRCRNFIDRVKDLALMDSIYVDYNGLWDIKDNTARCSLYFNSRPKNTIVTCTDDFSTLSFDSAYLISKALDNCRYSLKDETMPKIIQEGNKLLDKIKRDPTVKVNESAFWNYINMN